MKYKRRKKFLMSIGLTVGMLLIVGTAFADSINKSAYDQLKDSVKTSAYEMLNTIESQTTSITLMLKDNDKTLYAMTQVEKSDLSGKRKEKKETFEYVGREKDDYYSYSDDSCLISYDLASNTYYVTEFINNNPDTYNVTEFTNNNPDDYKPENPFESEYAKDVEKIFDALVGNLKNYVSIKVNADGTKEFSGSLEDAQIPALVNAIASFGSKQFFNSSSYRQVEFEGEYQEESIYGLPELSGDVSIKNVSANAIVNKDGIIQKGNIKGSLTGKDTVGNVHELSVEVLLSIDDINSTLVEKPDLTGKIVIKNIEDNKWDENIISKNYIGTYKRNIIIATKDSVTKIGEATLVISDISDGLVMGSYKEEYIAGYEEKYNDCSEFNFEADSYDSYSINFQFTDKSGNSQRGSVCFDDSSYDVQLYFDNNMNQTSSNFFRVFD